MSKKITIEITYEDYDKLMEMFTEKIKKIQPNSTFQEFIDNFFKMALNSHYQIMNMTDSMFDSNSNIAEIFDQFKNSFGDLNEPSISELMELMQKMNSNKKTKNSNDKNSNRKIEDKAINTKSKETFYKS